MGPQIRAALIRLGIVRLDVDRAVKMIRESSGRSFSRQRLNELMGQPHIDAATLDKLAAAFGVTRDQLLHPETIDPS
jgi:hypothetical protein